MKREHAKKCMQSSGRRFYLKHLDGETLSHRQRILAKCFECMGGYADGRIDCKIPDCPLYELMPYRDRETKPDSTATGGSGQAV